MPGKWAKTLLMAGLREVPYVGSAIKIYDRVQDQHQLLTMESDVADLRGQLTRTESRFRDVVRETIEEVVGELRMPGVDGIILQRLVREVKELQEHRYNPMFFDGLLANSSHYDQLKSNPENYGRLLDHNAEVAPGHFPVFVDFEKSGDTRILEVSPVALQALLSSPEKEGAAAQFMANPGALTDVWAAPDENSRVLTRGGGSRQPGQVFRDDLVDGTKGPEMVVIPPGQFMMGSELDSNEQPIHEVRIDYGLAVGRYPVTFDEYDHYCRRTDADEPGDQEWGRGTRPVINVTWYDANGYCSWLSRETGHTYRLLSESEWEYTARAGSTTEYPWGDDIGVNNANCEVSGTRWSGESTSPVGSFRPNEFGIYDMHGNVYEWCQDCWNFDYKDAPRNSSAWLTGECGGRVIRGGSWNSLPAGVRSAHRTWNVPDNRDFNLIGFRLARTK